MQFFKEIPMLTKEQGIAAAKGECPACNKYRLDAGTVAEGLWFKACRNCSNIVVLSADQVPKKDGQTNG